MSLSSSLRPTKMALAALVLLAGSQIAYSDDQLPLEFSEHAWLVNGIRSVASKEVELAPVTTCYDLNEKFAGDSSTSIQKKKEWRNYEDKYIPLTGILEEVKEIPLSQDYLAYFKCTNSASLFVDFTMRVPGELEDYAFSLSPGERHNVVVRLDRYGETMGVSTELDVINIDLGHDATCSAKLSSLSREDKSYRYSCEDPSVHFDRFFNKNGSPYFEGRLTREDGNIGIILPIPGKKDYALVNMGNGYLYYGGYGDSCYFSEKEINSDIGKDAYRELLKEAASEINSKMEERGIDQGPKDHLAINQIISEMNVEKYSCEIKQALRYIFVIYEHYNS